MNFGKSKPIPLPNGGELTLRDPETLTPYPNNPREIVQAVGVVRESIERFGFTSPIEIDADGEIVAGHTRREAAIAEGAKVVAVIQWSEMRGEESRAYRIAHNKTGEAATWDADKLQKELTALFDAGVSLDGIGFDEDALNDLLQSKPPEPSGGITTGPPQVECPKCGHRWEA